MEELKELSISRRNFLKYVGGAAVVAVVAGLGYYFSPCRKREEITPTPTTPTQTVTPTTTTTTTTTPTPTPTVELTSLYGRLFFDYNGNGAQDGEEPAVSKANVQLKDNTGKVIADAVTDSSGDYKLEDVPTGSYGLYVKPSNEKFRYMCTSLEEFRAVTEGYDVTLLGSGRMDIGLAEGLATLPIYPANPGYFYDRDPRPNWVKWWNGKVYQSSGGTGSDDGHAGTDFKGADNQVIFAAAPGVIPENGIQGVDFGSFTQYSIGIQHTNYSNGPKFNLGTIFTSYNHIKKPLVVSGQYVKRGDIIGVLYSGFSEPHLHFNIAIEITQKNLQLFIDLYGAPSDGIWGRKFGESQISWISDPDLLFLMNEGWWTEYNNPHYFNK